MISLAALRSTWRAAALLAALALALLALPARPVSADAAPMRAVGGSVMPVESSQVIMTGERVDLRPVADPRGFWLYLHVEATFVFRNDGVAAEVLMGFPVEAEGETWGFAGFAVEVDGQPTPVSFRQQAIPAGDIVFPGWHTFSVPFAAGETRQVTVRYTGANDTMEPEMRYVLQTGALWLGPIGQVEVLFHLDRMGWQWLGPDGILPDGYTMGTDDEGDLIRWQWQDLEPTAGHDIAISLRWSGSLAADASSGVLGKSTLPELALDGFPTTGWLPEPTQASPWLLAVERTWPAGPAYGLALRAGAEDAWNESGIDICTAVPRRVRLRFAVPGPGWAGFRAAAGDRFEALGRTYETWRPPEGPTLAGAIFAAGPEVVTWHETTVTLADRRDWQFVWLDQPQPMVAVQIVVEESHPCADGAAVPFIGDIQFPLRPTWWASFSQAWQGPALLMDGDPATAWVTGGVGEWAEIQWPAGARPVTGLRVVNGHAAGPGEFAAYSRAARLRLTFDGAADRFVDLLDTTQVQTFTWDPPIAAGRARLTLDALTSGLANLGVALSEVEWLTGRPANAVSLTSIMLTPVPSPTPTLTATPAPSRPALSTRTPPPTATPSPSRTEAPTATQTPGASASPTGSPTRLAEAVALVTTTAPPTATAAATAVPVESAGSGICGGALALGGLALAATRMTRRQSPDLRAGRTGPAN